MADSPNDNNAYRFPVSVKGIIIRRGAVLLLENRRNEWELPGGKLELSETPEVCVAREIHEELKLTITPGLLVDSWVYTLAADVHVLILSYGCLESVEREPVVSDEHTRFQWFPVDEVASLPMPEGYKASIRRWAMHAGTARSG